MKKMNQKRGSYWIDFTFSLTLILLTVGALYLITINSREEPIIQSAAKKQPSHPPVTIDTIDSNYPGIKIITETSNDPDNRFAIQYPQSVHRIFNEEITTYITKKKENHFKLMLKNSNLTPKRRGELNISFETLSHPSGNYSFVLVTSSSTSEIEGQTEIRSFHLKPETGKKITLQEVFNNDVKTLEDISTKVRQNLTTDPALEKVLNKEVMTQKTTPLWKNYKNFALTDNSIVFYFNENEMTAAVVGPPIVAIPLQDINNLLAIEFKLEEQSHEASSGKGEQESIESTVEKDTLFPSPPVKNETHVEKEVGTDDANPTEKSDDTSIEQVVTGKRVALTFDDGPDPKYTTQILSILKKYDAKATFFMLGSRVEYYPETAKNIQQAGHQLANHSWNHLDLTKVSVDKIQKEINNTSAIIEKVTGQKATAFRPPYGAVNKTVRVQCDLPIVLWSVDTLDWKHRDATKLLQIVKQNTVDGSIILMHDIHRSTADGLEAVLAYLHQEGYSFVTVSELN